MNELLEVTRLLKSENKLLDIAEAQQNRIEELEKENRELRFRLSLKDANASLPDLRRNNTEGVK